MANVFKDISQFTLKSAATGTEEFQVSATEKVTAQQIADLASSGLNVYTISESESQNQKIDASRVEELKKSVIVLFPNEVGYTPYLKVSADDSKAYFITGIVPINSQGQPGINNGEEPPFEQVQTVMIEVDLTTRDITVWPYPVVKKEWLQTSDVIEVGDFTTINEVWPTKTVPGTMCPFYTGSEVYSAPDATETKYVGFVILDSDFATQGGATVVAIAQTSGRQYVGKLDFNGQSIDWCATVNNPVTVTDFKSLPNFVKTAKDGEIIPIIAPASASNGPTGLVSTGPAYGYVQVAKTGSTKAYNFLVQMDSAGNGPRMYTGFVNTVANLIYWLPLNEEMNPNVLHGENIEEGLEYLIPDNVGDTVAFRITGDSSQVPNTTEGFGLLSKINGSESLVIAAQINSANTNEEILYTGRVQNDGTGTTWNKVGMGPEKISNWTNTDISYMPSICPTDEHVILNLTRATKTTDILRIDLIKSDDNSHYQVLSPVVHVAAADVISQDGYNIVLDERYVNPVNGDFSKLSFENGSSISNTSTLKLYINKGGSVPDDNYYIVGIYNISGK